MTYAVSKHNCFKPFLTDELEEMIRSRSCGQPQISAGAVATNEGYSWQRFCAASLLLTDSSFWLRFLDLTKLPATSVVGKPTWEPTTSPWLTAFYKKHFQYIHIHTPSCFKVALRWWVVQVIVLLNIWTSCYIMSAKQSCSRSAGRHGLKRTCCVPSVMKWYPSLLKDLEK